MVSEEVFEDNCKRLYGEEVFGSFVYEIVHVPFISEKSSSIHSAGSDGRKAVR